LEVFAVLKYFLNNATNIFKSTEIILNNINKTIFISLYFFSHLMWTPVRELYCHTAHE
jgi:hypothetical protein